ncbi:MAG: LysR substrate-binding domain-containing protein [Rhodoferax sp.]|uniref:LysR family transcriptional regulator n=1 Tax=Rhodoferax sp. TaxID=50421 RepID=UPI003266B224
MIEELRTFLAVAAAGNFSQVARQQNVAVSSVTRKIDTLETDLSVKLFRRSSRQVLLTDAGEQFAISARRIVAELDDAKDALAELQADPRGVLTVTAPTSFGQRYVMPVAAHFLRQYPQIELELHLSDQWVDLAAQRVDVAIRVGSLPDSDLVATHLAPMRRLVCASPDYLAQHGTPTQLQDLALHRCLTTATTPPVGMWSFVGVQAGRPLPVRGPLRTNDIEALQRAAVDGLGIVHLASWLLCDMLAAGKLVQLFPEASTPPTPSPTAIHAVRLPGRSHAAKAQLFIAQLKREFGEPAYWDRAVPR